MKYVAWVIGLIIIIVVLIIGANLVRNTIFGSQATIKTEDAVNLNDFNKPGVTLRYRVIGPIIAEENHRELQMDITANGRNAKIFSGYNGTVLKQTNHSNNQAAFTEFIEALGRAGFVTERTNAKETTLTGQCATGSRFIAEIIQDGQSVKELWRTSCGVNEGTLAGNVTAIEVLFKKQFPDYNQLSQGVALTNSNFSL